MSVVVENEGTANQRIKTTPGQGYALFGEAERLNMTVAKLLTGKDLPLGQMEWVLTQTYRMAKQRLDKDQGKGKRRQA